MLSVVTMERVLTNVIDKTHMKPFSEYYVSIRATVVRYFVLTPSDRGSKKIFQPDRTNETGLASISCNFITYTNKKTPLVTGQMNNVRKQCFTKLIKKKRHLWWP
jgi:hypothetical protein